MVESYVVKCPECGILIELDSLVSEGDPVFCPECETEFTIVSLSPPRLKQVSDSESEGAGNDDITDWYPDDNYEKGYDY